MNTYGPSNLIDDNDALAFRLASDLLRIGAVRFSPDEPFTWASGLRSPVYCDNRLTIGFVDIRRRISAGLAARIDSSAVDIVAGTATAGIPHAAWLADRLSKPMVYVRSASKGHGTGGRIEGPTVPGARAVIIEDLVSTGGSSIDAAGALREVGFYVDTVMAIFSYGLPVARKAFAAAELRLTALTNLETLIRAGEQSATLTADNIQTIRLWQSDPQAWSNRFTDMAGSAR